MRSAEVSVRPSDGRLDFLAASCSAWISRLVLEWTLFRVGDRNRDHLLLGRPDPAWLLPYNQYPFCASVALRSRYKPCPIG